MDIALPLGRRLRKRSHRVSARCSGGIPVKAEALDGDTWTAVISRKLKSDKPGDISFEPGQLYTMGIAAR